MSSEKFCLRWNDFERNISHAFQELREDKDFFDVTIACDDEQMKAHKVILAACSPFFKTILLRNKHEHPLLYLKGVKCVDLVSPDVSCIYAKYEVRIAACGMINEKYRSRGVD